MLSNTPPISNSNAGCQTGLQAFWTTCVVNLLPHYGYVFGTICVFKSSGCCDAERVSLYGCLVVVVDPRIYMSFRNQFSLECVFLVPNCIPSCTCLRQLLNRILVAYVLRTEIALLSGFCVFLISGVVCHCYFPIDFCTAGSTGAWL